MPQLIAIPIKTEETDLKTDITDRPHSIMEKSTPIYVSLVLLSVLVFLLIGAIYSNLKLL